MKLFFGTGQALRPVVAVLILDYSGQRGNLGRGYFIRARNFSGGAGPPGGGGGFFLGWLLTAVSVWRQPVLAPQGAALLAAVIFPCLALRYAGGRSQSLRGATGWPRVFLC